MQCLAQFQKVKEASRELARVKEERIINMLNKLADEAENNIPQLLNANQKILTE